MINELTAAQTGQLAHYRDEWLKRGMPTKSASRRETVEIVHDLYENLLDKKKKVPVVILGSPLAAWVAVCMLTPEGGGESEIDQKIWTSTATQIKRQIGVTIEEGERKIWEFIWPYVDGHYFAPYFAFYEFMFSALKIENPVPEKYSVLKRTVKLGPVYPLDDYCVVSKVPVEYHWKDKVLHNPDGMAVKYEDGFGVYCLNGVAVPEWLVLTPWDELDPARFAKIDNAEVRREFVRKVGIERISEACKAKCIDKEGDYELLVIDLKGDTGEWPYLKMLNPSMEGIYHLECVAKECHTVEQALNWRNQSSLPPESLT